MKNKALLLIGIASLLITATALILAARGRQYMLENNNTALRSYRGKQNDVVVPQGVKEIGDHAFGKCSSLKSKK